MLCESQVLPLEGVGGTRCRPPLGKARFSSATAQPDLRGLRPRAGRVGGKREEVEEGEREPRCREGSAGGVGDGHQAPYWSFSSLGYVVAMS